MNFIYLIHLLIVLTLVAMCDGYAYGMGTGLGKKGDDTKVMRKFAHQEQIQEFSKLSFKSIH